MKPSPLMCVLLTVAVIVLSCRMSFRIMAGMDVPVTVYFDIEAKTALHVGFVTAAGVIVYCICRGLKD